MITTISTHHSICVFQFIISLSSRSNSKGKKAQFTDENTEAQKICIMAQRQLEVYQGSNQELC